MERAGERRAAGGRHVAGGRRPRRRETWDLTTPRVGQVVGGYRLEARLGEGGQGTVFRARRGGRLYAIKFLSLEMEERAWRELEVWLRLRRVGEVRLEGCGRWPARTPRFLFIAMPYVRGRPLDVWARVRNPTAWEVVRVVREVARQLMPVHRANVVHRDVKAANVLVRREDGRAVLVDFGLGTYPGALDITHPLAMPGTPLYRSPEMLRFRREYAGSERYQARASDDLWALGVLLYWLLTGSHPFDVEEPEADAGALANIILRREPQPPHAHNPRVPRVLSELCLRMLEKSPEARFQDAEAVGAELEAVLAEADGSWDVALCETWSPGDASTPQEVLLGLGEWRERARRLVAYARRYPRRGRPLSLAAASTQSGSREAEAEPASTPSRARGRLRRVGAWGFVLGLGLLGAWVALLVPSRPEPEAPRVTREVVSVPTMPEVTGTGQEVARPGKPPDGDGGAATHGAATPAPVASATPRKDSTRVKTPKQATFSPKQQDKQGTVLDSVARACATAYAVGQVACASPEAQLRPTLPRLPPPADCPAGSEESMRALGLGIGAREIFAFHTEGAMPITVRPGPVTVELSRDWVKMDGPVRFTGELLFGQGRVYGRFTQAHTQDGQTHTVCFDLYEVEEDNERGALMEPGSGSDTARIWSTVELRAVRRFE